MSEPEFVRVSDKRTGAHYTVNRPWAERDQNLTILKQDAVDANGSALPAKSKSNLAPGKDTKATEANTEATKEAK